MSGSSSLTTVQPGKLRIIASDFDARPMSYLDEEGRRLGYEPAAAEAICKKLGLEPVWYNFSPSEFYTQLSSGAYDVVWFSQPITQTKRAWADFTRAYGRFDVAVLVRDESAIATVEDLKSVRLGASTHGIELDLINQLPDLEIVEFSGGSQILPDMIKAVQSKVIDAVLDNALLLLAAESMDQDLRVAFEIPTQIPFGVGVVPGNRELLDALNFGFNQLIAEGTLAKLWARWIPYKPCPF
ncbi:MAG: amino acid ABC transporter substrate-binding protein [Leptolyngbyaceae cyanobacterium SM1_1_3]|nr:amino acid ABC transporter substrate-binding protein [Leptolyngbyaceae cyanobacterium SM1_1_3]NJN04090.1 amino acid ABC transporter substrate-binding protein [Leptolyngbyaceae cyanobacterium RM1_1_2]NJO11254.1 amino acid ABC transporter substrate-binding protein [Leptolyngbyaceae cyanobacterium SL_1_1]